MKEALTAEGLMLVREAVERLEKAYHPEDGFVWLKLDEDREHPRLRESMYYALGGLTLAEYEAAREAGAGNNGTQTAAGQNGNGRIREAAARAERIITAVLDTQMDAPGEVWHGAFRHPDAERPPKMPFDWRTVSLKARYQADVAWERITGRFGQLLQEEAPEERGRMERLLKRALTDTIPVAWDTYEPNVREFIGITLAMALEHFEERLPAELVKRIEESGRLLTEGAIARAESDFTPLNTNIQIIYIFLLDWFGHRLDRADWSRKAENEASRLADSYREYHSAAEFNSPTYCGVDLSMLGFWRRYGHSETLRALGEELESGIWRDMADFYNPAMRNFCGPYSRCYELEMRLHTCMYDLLYLGLGERTWPDHPFSIESYGDPLLVLGRVTVPEDVKPRLLANPEERLIRRSFRELSERGDPDGRHALCTATAWIRPEIMAGAMAGSENTSYQLHPLVAFWRMKEGLGTIRMGRCLADGTMCHLHTVLFDGGVTAGQAEMTVRNLCGQDAEAFFEIQGDGIRKDMIADGRWTLPGLTVKLEAEPAFRAEQADDRTVRVYYALPATGEAVRFSLRFDWEK